MAILLDRCGSTLDEYLRYESAASAPSGFEPNPPAPFVLTPQRAPLLLCVLALRGDTQH
ncbi:hypothetical protein GCM10023321_53950 [Pseudonocardia eucalypti]|uniref:Uncharacterized protein n=1 Tax=Pseudonocardia eucalypti TaxID=648755 RepID=A0ABP9QPG7_9PSEU